MFEWRQYVSKPTTKKAPSRMRLYDWHQRLEFLFEELIGDSRSWARHCRARYYEVGGSNVLSRQWCRQRCRVLMDGSNKCQQRQWPWTGFPMQQEKGENGGLYKRIVMIQAWAEGFGWGRTSLLSTHQGWCVLASRTSEAEANNLNS